MVAARHSEDRARQKASSCWSMAEQSQHTIAIARPVALTRRQSPTQRAFRNAPPNELPPRSGRWETGSCEGPQYDVPEPGSFKAHRRVAGDDRTVPTLLREVRPTCEKSQLLRCTHVTLLAGLLYSNYFSLALPASRRGLFVPISSGWHAPWSLEGCKASCVCEVMVTPDTARPAALEMPMREHRRAMPTLP
eukprot:scaffold997_cov418-Prasinococcus_capsulatus_cf.AAC.4